MKKLVMILVSVCMLAGCSGDKEKKVSKTHKEETPVVLSESGHDVREAVDKSETITVKSDLYGNVKSMKAQVNIPSISEGDMIKDTTVLKDISNKGDENITLSGHKLLVENNKNSINYEGKLQTEVPVGVEVSYYLDGQKVTDIEGKSGKLKIVFKYKNKTDVPFVAASIMLIPQENVGSIEVTNGKSMNMDDYQAIVGIGCPGYEPFSDHVEVSMDVKDFKYEYMSTVFSDGVFKDLDLSDLNKVTKELNDSSGKLVEGASKLSAGCTTYGQYLESYMSNVNKVSTGTKALLQGSKQYDDTTKTLIETLVSQLQDENKLIETIQAKVNDVNLSDSEKQEVMKAVSAGVHEGLQNSTGYANKLKQLLENSPVSKQLETLSSSLQQLDQAGNTLVTQYQILEKGASSLSEGMSLFDSKGIKKLTDLSKINKLKNNDHYEGLTGKNITSTKFIFEME